MVLALDKHQRLLVQQKLRTIRNARSRASQPQAQISWALSLNSKHSKPIAIVEEDCHCVGCFQHHESSFPKTTFPSRAKVKALPMNAESRPLQMNQLSLRNNRIKFQATGKLGIVLRESILECTSNQEKTTKRTTTCNQMDLETIRSTEQLNL